MRGGEKNQTINLFIIDIASTIKNLKERNPAGPVVL
jgi:hypothetical protein